MSELSYQFTPLKGYEDFEATTQIIIAEILKRGLPFEIIDSRNNLIAVTWQNREYVIHEGTISDGNSLIAYWISNDKWMTRQFLHREKISLARGILLQKGEGKEAVNQINFPLVVKPANTDHGIGISTQIGSEKELHEAVDRAFGFADKVIVEEYFAGQEFRFLVVEGTVRAIAYLEPANVIGDGISSIARLIEAKNIGRGDDYRYPLLKIKVDDEVLRHLNKQKKIIDSVSPKGEKVYLRKNSNLSTGGDSIDVTDTMPGFYKEVAVKAAAAAGLKIAGVDMIIMNLEAEASTHNYIVIELNAPAMLSMHDFPYIGKNRHVEKYVLDCILNSKR